MTITDRWLHFYRDTNTGSMFVIEHDDFDGAMEAINEGVDDADYLETEHCEMGFSWGGHPEIRRRVYNAEGEAHAFAVEALREQAGQMALSRWFNESAR